MAAFQNILIIRFSSLGDLVLTTPVYRELRRCFPNARLTLLTSIGFGEVLANNPHLDEIHYHPRKEHPADRQALLEWLQQERFDLIYDLHASLRSRWVSLMLQASGRSPEVWRINKRTLRRTLLIRLQMNWLKGARSQREQWLQPLVRHQGHELDAHTELFPSAADRAKVAAVLKEHDLAPKQFVAVGPGASYELKRWPVEYFEQVIRNWTEVGWQVVLVGGPGEVEPELLQRRVGTGVVNLAGQLSLLESAALLEQAQWVLCNDTSIAHLAEAMGTPAHVLFGPTVREFGYAPFLPDSQVLETSLPLMCRPCSRDGRGTCSHPQSLRCMTSLLPEEIPALRS